LKKIFNFKNYLSSFLRLFAPIKLVIPIAAETTPKIEAASL